MRIESINLSLEDFNNMDVGSPTLPLDNPLQMRNLGQCVVIAGKNGSGKTRLLTLVEQIANRYLTQENRQALEFQESEKSQHKLHYEREVERIQSNGAPTGALQAQLERNEQNLDRLKKELEQIKKKLALNRTLEIQGTGTPKIVSFVPRSTELKDPVSLVDGKAEELARSFSMSLSIHDVNEGAPAYARQIMRAAVAERGRRDSNPSITRHQQSEQELLNLFQSLLGGNVQLELGDNLNLCLKGLTDHYSALLSDGQKVLFQLACMLHSRHASLHDCLILLDEPENHLHPSVLNELVDRLQELLSDGQLWISTHSVPLIAHLVANDQNCLWFAEDGRFKPAGRSPEKVLDSLLGGPDGARRVNDLTLMPSRFASSIFLRQCLLDPSVIGYHDGDPQLEQIRQELRQLRVSSNPICIIDFGSGKGRLLDAIAQDSEGTPLEKVVDYLAYEPYIPDAEKCQKLCLKLYGAEKQEQRAFSNLDHIIKLRGKKFADVAIVCNVLHEVDPKDWLRNFGGESELSDILKDEGYILFIEDYALPVGERAHDFGFLLLDEDQLIELFGITPDDIASKHFTRTDHSNPRYQGRLIAHLVSTRCLKKMSESTKRQSIQSLQSQSLNRLKELLLNQSTSSDQGRESALVTQLAANATLWLRENT